MSSPVQLSEQSFIQAQRFTIPAGKTVEKNVFGRTFACTDATAPFEVSFNSGEFFPVKKGVEWALIGEDRYNKIAFRGGAADVEVECYFGNFFWHENVVVPVIKAAKTKAIPGLSEIPASSSVVFETPPAGLSWRKSILVTNNDPSVDLEIDVQDPADPLTWIPAAIVFAKQAWLLETSAGVRVRNPSAGPVNYRVLELFYLS